MHWLLIFCRYMMLCLIVGDKYMLIDYDAAVSDQRIQTKRHSHNKVTHLLTVHVLSAGCFFDSDFAINSILMSMAGRNTVNLVGSDILSYILRMATETGSDMMHGIQRHRRIAELACTCRMWSMILLPRIARSLVVEHLGQGKWMTNIGFFRYWKCSTWARNLTLAGVIDGNALSTMQTMLQRQEFQLFDWRRVREIRFETRDLSRSLLHRRNHSYYDVCAYLCQLLPNLATLDYVGWHLHPRLFECEMRYWFSRLLVLGDGVFHIDRYLQLHRLASLASHVTHIVVEGSWLDEVGNSAALLASQFRHIRIYNIIGEISWRAFAGTGQSQAVEFTNLEGLELYGFYSTDHKVSVVDAGLALRFPRLQTLDISQSCRLYSDLYSMFHDFAPATLRVWERAADFQRINPRIMRAAKTLNLQIGAKMVPRDLHIADLASIDAHLRGHRFMAYLQSSNLRHLTLGVLSCHYTFVEELLGRLPCLWYLRVECSCDIVSERESGDDYEPVEPLELSSRIGVLPCLQEFIFRKYHIWTPCDYEWIRQLVLCSPSLLKLSIPGTPARDLSDICMSISRSVEVLDSGELYIGDSMYEFF
ncbi:hypothetical protein DL89DRAFT_136487 [Linderina pennispora]|uniref:F-box domain-containing protein n=1 Tax=Linderina pennispora TaxID=61395 RepID=A0A1Y1WAN5_9FUNG|nr:uncharacterized protein DL89DRAFT_136487 [Linderina pennispora]ORX70607.1 hypothetical protein DL89DRAFT_136487 [Linderina pennispora]